MVVQSALYELMCPALYELMCPAVAVLLVLGVARGVGGSAAAEATPRCTLHPAAEIRAGGELPRPPVWAGTLVECVDACESTPSCCYGQFSSDVGRCGVLVFSGSSLAPLQPNRVCRALIV